MRGVRSLLRAFFFSVCSCGQAYNEKETGLRSDEAMFCIFSAYFVDPIQEFAKLLIFSRSAFEHVSVQ